MDSFISLATTVGKLVATVTISAFRDHGASRPGFQVPQPRVPPQFALNDSQSVQKAARLDRHERRRGRGKAFINQCRDGGTARRRDTFCEGTGMRPILAFAILLLGLSRAAPEPEYSRYFTDYLHSTGGEAASPLVEIESSTGRADRLSVASLQPHAIPVETLKPASADASADADSDAVASTDGAIRSTPATCHSTTCAMRSSRRRRTTICRFRSLPI